MGVQEHRRLAGKTPVRCFVLTLSDTRTEATDDSGRLTRELVEAAGHAVTGYAIVKDDEAAIRQAIHDAVEQQAADVILANGGTGVAPRDCTAEVLWALCDRHLDGFGELFRMISYQQVGSAAMLSRAVAGLIGPVAIFAMPGSPEAVKLALERLILPELPHLVSQMRR